MFAGRGVRLRRISLEDFRKPASALRFEPVVDLRREMLNGELM